jgi:hypothetical protein
MVESTSDFTVRFCSFTGEREVQIMTLESVFISPKLNWQEGVNSISRPTDLTFLQQEPSLVPNAYSLIWTLLRKRGFVRSYTYDDDGIKEITEKYSFARVTSRPLSLPKGCAQNCYFVGLDRSAEQLPSIYQWFEDHQVDLKQFEVPWIHLTHTFDTLGFCPFCEGKLEHDNWHRHTNAACLGYQASNQLAELGPCHDSFAINMGKAGFIPNGKGDALNFMDGGRRLLLWKTLYKTVSGTYVCWERSDDYQSGPQRSPSSSLFVYGSTPNGISNWDEGEREAISLDHTVPVGTMIKVSIVPLEEGYYWGVL